MRSASRIALFVVACAFSPARAEKPSHYVYAELRCQRCAVEVRGKAVAQIQIRWTTAEGDIDASEWADLADKLKVPAAKKEGSATMHRLRVFRHLTEDGWEITSGGDGSGGGNSPWTFRKLVP